MKLKSLALLLMTIAMPAMAEQVSVNSKGISLILDVENGKQIGRASCRERV